MTLRSLEESTEQVEEFCSSPFSMYIWTRTTPYYFSLQLQIEVCLNSYLSHSVSAGIKLVLRYIFLVWGYLSIPWIQLRFAYGNYLIYTVVDQFERLFLFHATTTNFSLLFFFLIENEVMFTLTYYFLSTNRCMLWY